MIKIQTDDFDIGVEIELLRQSHPSSGAIVSFVGQVRDFNQNMTVSSLTIEHYPAMTEKLIAEIVDEAKSRWLIEGVVVIHRIGEMKPLDKIVLVAVASPHREEAFLACSFIMDYLKTGATFWKKEGSDAGLEWLASQAKDDEARLKWKKN